LIDEANATTAALLADKEMYRYVELLSRPTAISHMGPNLPYLNAIIDERTTRKQRHVKCSHRVAKIAQTAQNKRLHPYLARTCFKMDCRIAISISEGSMTPI